MKSSIPRQNDSHQEFRLDAIEQSISDRFEQQARLYPDRIAVSTPHGQYDYDHVNRMANRIARTIISQYHDNVAPVALIMEQGAPQIIATLGTLKAGKFYVPLDPANPVSRNQYMLRDSTARLLVTNNKNLDIANEISGPEHAVLNIDQIADHISDADLKLPISPDAFSYILYTSGSTGNPKGILQNHRNVLHNVMRHSNAFRICPEDRQTLLYTSSVYGGQRDMFNALLNGASLHAYVVKTEGLEGLASWLALNRISIYCSVSTVFRQLTNAFTGTESFDQLRLIKLGGEATTKRDVEAYKKYFSSACIMHCGLGSTETGLVRNYFINKSTPIIEHTVPLGYPIDDIEVLLLDETGNPLPDETAGEIAIKSRYISLGYWNRPELTQQAFCSDPNDKESRIYRTGDSGLLRLDGCLAHRGRMDFQLKIRGNRIETAEIELTLLGLASVMEAVVIGVKDKQGSDELAAYLVASGSDKPDANSLWQSLIGLLPEHMIPTYFVWLSSLPLLPNGKVDRHALPKPEMANRERAYTQPSSDLERKISEIWQDILTTERVGVSDNFFVIGGNSILAAQVIARINRSFGLNLPLSKLFEMQTITGLTQAVISDQAEKLPLQDIALMLENIESLPDIEAMKLLKNKIESNPDET